MSGKQPDIELSTAYEFKLKIAHWRGIGAEIEKKIISKKGGTPRRNREIIKLLNLTKGLTPGEHFHFNLAFQQRGSYSKEIEHLLSKARYELYLSNLENGGYIRNSNLRKLYMKLEKALRLVEWHLFQYNFCDILQPFDERSVVYGPAPAPSSP
ncbi:hypothetical protein EYC80_010780 [Monilinia laxa]|uniref:Uncharacterized protein n=1 Tax=Monilinia laxa TaxID=61186 RepID=A0A5N6JM78_MONLA|nr:hypothetical protein EYC80_010780 [Monilinia laxa]